MNIKSDTFINFIKRYGTLDLDRFYSIDIETPNTFGFSGWIPYRGRKFHMDYVNSSVEDLIQETKNQNGRVYQTLKNQESRIKELESELSGEKVWRMSHSCVNSLTGHIELFNVLVSRIGTKGILKMLAER